MNSSWTVPHWFHFSQESETKWSCFPLRANKNITVQPIQKSEVFLLILIPFEVIVLVVVVFPYSRFGSRALCRECVQLCKLKSAKLDWLVCKARKLCKQPLPCRRSQLARFFGHFYHFKNTEQADYWSLWPFSWLFWWEHCNFAWHRFLSVISEAFRTNILRKHAIWRCQSIEKFL